MMKLSLLLNQYKGNESVGEKSEALLINISNVSRVKESLRLLTILRSCFNEAAVAALLITRLNCHYFTLKQQHLVQEAESRVERSCFLLCVFDGGGVSLLSFQAYTYVWQHLTFDPCVHVQG